MSSFWKKFEKTIGIAGNVMSMACLIYNFCKSTSKIDLKPNDVYSVTEVAKILGISQEETMKLIYDGKLTAQQMGGKYKIRGSNIVSLFDE